MNILITGGAGFIGTALTKRLIEKGHQVTIIDKLSSQIHGESASFDTHPLAAYGNAVVFYKGDVRNIEDWKIVLPNQEVIVHLAAETGTGQSMYEIKRYTDVNIEGTALLLDYLANHKHQVKKIVVASSRALYGEGKYISPKYGVVYPGSRKIDDLQSGRFNIFKDEYGDLEVVATDEESKIHPSSVYGITKQLQEQLVMTVCPTINIQPVALRYQNVYGPGQSLRNPYTGIISIFTGLVKQGEPINIFEDGMESRDFVFIDDVVEATVLSIENQKANGKIFNVGTGIPTTVMDVANSISRELGIEVPIRVSGEFRLGDIRHNYAEISLIRNTLHFSPQIDFNKGLSIFIRWAKEQPIEALNYQHSLREMREKGLMKK